MKGILSALLIALFYTLGQDWLINWYDARHNEYNIVGVDDLFEVSGPLASLPPSRNCPYGNALPWWMTSVVFTIPFNLCSMIIFNIRCKDLVGAFLVAQATYCGKCMPC